MQSAHLNAQSASIHPRWPSSVRWGIGLVITLLLLHLSIIVTPAYLTGIHTAYQAGLRLKDIDFEVPGYSLWIYGQPQPAYPSWVYAPIVGLLTAYSVKYLASVGTILILFGMSRSRSAPTSRQGLVLGLLLILWVSTILTWPAAQAFIVWLWD